MHVCCKQIKAALGEIYCTYGTYFSNQEGVWKQVSGQFAVVYVPIFSSHGTLCYLPREPTVAAGSPRRLVPQQTR